MSAKVTSLEESYKKELSVVSGNLKQQGVSTEKALKKQSENLDITNKEVRSSLQIVMFNAAMATVSGNLIKVQVELKSKNVGIAKIEY